MLKLLKAAIKAVFRAYGHYPVSIDGFKFHCYPSGIGFWRQVNLGRWEADTFRILKEHVRPDAVYMDIGAWIGPTVMYAAKLCRKVYCFEPDFYAYRRLLGNIQLNRLTNVTPFNVAFTAENRIVKMSSFGNELGDSQSSVLTNAINDNSIDVWGINFRTFINLISPEVPSFIKIDIEGGEFDLIPDMKDYLAEYKPTIYLSTHAPMLPENERIKSLNRIGDVLGAIYNKCIDENRSEQGLEILVHETTANQFKSFLFMS